MTDKLVELAAKALWDDWVAEEAAIEHEYVSWEVLPDKDTWRRRARAALESLTLPQTDLEQPIPMLLYCPKCGVQHIDEEEHVLVWTGGSVPEPSHDEVVWDNPPHRSHLCHGCGCIWRPADVPTNGVASIETAGKADTWAPAALASSSVPEQDSWQPIETAPKDGSPFLVYLPQASWEASLKPTMTVMYWASWQNFASLYADRIGETEGDAGDWGPTHWMPLPPPPEAPQDRGASQEDDLTRQALEQGSAE